MKVVLYARVSTRARIDATGDLDGQTLDPQWVELRRIAAERRWEVVEECSDVMSGGKAKRPGMDRVVELAIAGAVNAVVCVKIDRIARSMTNFCFLIRTLKEANCALIVTGQNIDTSDESPHGVLMQNILMSFAEFERGIIRSRVMAGLEAAKARGAVLGRPSAKMIRGTQAVDIVNAWRVSAGSYAELGRLLGGVSAATAWRQERRMVKAGEIAPVGAPEADSTDRGDGAIDPV